jgi:release factor glutamine methyltransferase
MKLLEVLDFGSKKLKGYSSNPEFESLVLLEEATGKNKEKIFVYNEQIGNKDFCSFKNYLARRGRGEPWQYIVKKTNFLGFDIFCEEGVFIPRPETEWMTVRTIKKLKDFDTPLILEIGCGTGAISISIAFHNRKAKIIATDISKQAVNLCKRNIDYHNLDSQIDVVCADLLDCFDNAGIFDMVISNPPYIPENSLDAVDGVVKREPSLALNGGDGGSKVINEILKSSKDKLKNGGLIFIEVDDLNIPYIEVPEVFNYTIEKDQFGRDRILCGVKI